jgi:two-component system sensor histidine kinase NreB
MADTFQQMERKISGMFCQLDEPELSQLTRQEIRFALQQLLDLKFALDESSIVALTDANGTIRYVNDKFCEISKYARQELLGQDHRIINSGYHSKLFFRDLWATISSGNVWHGDIRNRAKDGTHYWMKTTITPFLDQLGKPYQYLAVRTEITEQKRAESALQEMMKQLLYVQENERRRLSLEMHDGIGQSLYSLLVAAEQCSLLSGKPLARQLSGIKSEITQLIEDVRRMSWELRPSLLDDLGLVPALRSFFQRFHEHYEIHVDYSLDLAHRLSQETETVVFRIVQEALMNARKHATAKEIVVRLHVSDGQLIGHIADRGRGMDVATVAQGVGLLSMRERARGIGGVLHIHSALGKGTTVSFQLPV